MKAKGLLLWVSLLILAAFTAPFFLSACGGGPSGSPTPAPERGTAPAPTLVASPTPARASPTPPEASPTPTTAASTPSPAGTGREIRVTIKDNTFPKELRVKAGERVVFVVTNQGPEKHSFELPDFNMYEEIRSGQTARIEWVVADKKGRWDMGCFLTEPDGPHDGMEGVLVIE